MGDDLAVARCCPTAHVTGDAAFHIIDLLRYDPPMNGLQKHEPDPVGTAARTVRQACCRYTIAHTGCICCCASGGRQYTLRTLLNGLAWC